MKNEELKHVIALLLEDAKRRQELEPNAGTEARIWLGDYSLTYGRIVNGSDGVIGLPKKRNYALSRSIKNSSFTSVTRTFGLGLIFQKQLWPNVQHNKYRLFLFRINTLRSEAIRDRNQS